MLITDRPRSFVALVALLAIVFSTTPISAADFNTKPVLGSVSAVGSVELRGVTISQEGTLFPGDQVSVGAKGYAKVTLLNGHKLELASMTRLTVVGSKQSAQLQVTSGNLGFTTQSGALDIAAGNYQITGDRNVAGNVAYVGNGFVGLHVKAGTVTVRNRTTKETVKVGAGQDRMFSLQGDMNRPLAQLASNGLPGPLPTVPPAPAPQGGSKNSGSDKGWIMYAAAGAAFIAGAVFMAKKPEDTTAASNTLLAKLRAQGSASTAATTAATATTEANQAATAATAVAAAVAAATNLPAATRTTLTTQAQTLAAAAQATQAQIATLANQLQTLQTQLSNTTDQNTVLSIQNQIATVINSLNADTTQLNAQISQLNSLIQQAQAAGVQGTPTVTIQPIAQVPPPASGSTP